MKKSKNPLSPPHIAQLFSENYLLEHCHSLHKPLIGRHEAVFMLNAQDAIIAYHPEVADEILPEAIVVAVAYGPEYPGSVDPQGYLS